VFLKIEFKPRKNVIHHAAPMEPAIHVAFSCTIDTRHEARDLKPEYDTWDYCVDTVPSPSCSGSSIGTIGSTGSCDDTQLEDPSVTLCEDVDDPSVTLCEDVDDPSVTLCEDVDDPSVTLCEDVDDPSVTLCEDVDDPSVTLCEDVDENSDDSSHEDSDSETDCARIRVGQSLSMPCMPCMPRIDTEFANAVRYRCISSSVLQCDETATRPDILTMVTTMNRNIFRMDEKVDDTLADSFKCLKCNEVCSLHERVVETWPIGMRVNIIRNESIVYRPSTGCQASFCVKCHGWRVNSKTLIVPIVSDTTATEPKTELRYHFEIQPNTTCMHCELPLYPPTAVVKLIGNRNEYVYECAYMHDACCRVYFPFRQKYIKCFSNGTYRYNCSE